jgi:two-component system LytT family sensor kinase
MKATQKKILFFIGRNLAVYVCLILLSFFFTTEEKKTVYWHTVFGVITSFYIWALIHNIFLFERLFLRRKYVWYFILLPIVLVLLTFVHRALTHAMAENKSSFQSTFFANLEFTIIGVLFYLAFRYLMERKTFFQVKMMQREVELQQLKAHLNPHFLFNALNNIYSYTLQHNRYGNELILKLSELMRFILDCNERSQITIGEEIGFIRNYIVFEQERLGERCDINCDIIEGDRDRQVAPLILFPFIENACKYGSDTIQKTQIDIVIENNDQQLRLVVTNSIVNRNPPSTKTGLHNTIRRLELLYPNKHEVLITTDDNVFTVELILRYEN